MKKKHFLIIVLILILIGIFGCYQKYNSDIIAKTNLYTISEKEVENYIKYSKLKYQSIFGSEEWDLICDTDTKKDVLIKNTIENIILTENHKKENKKLNLERPKEESINLHDKKIKTMLEKYKLKPEFIREATLAEQEDRIYENYKMSKIKISEKEIKNYYKKHRNDFTQYYANMYQIWIKTSENGKSTKQLAEEAYKKIKSGVSFEKVAQEYSQEKDRSYIGRVNEETTLKPIRDVFINMQNGEISKPIETSNGYFIIKIENKKKEVENYLDVKSEIGRIVKENKFYKEEAKFLEKESIEYKKSKFKELYNSF